LALTGFPLPPLLVGLGFGERAIRRFADRMTRAGRYHVFRAGSRHFLDGEFVIEASYRKRGHASAGAWIELDGRGRVTAEDVVCFDDILPEAEVVRRSRLPAASASPSAPAPGASLDLPGLRALRTA
jgi:hypothetical protein